MSLQKSKIKNLSAWCDNNTSTRSQLKIRAKYLVIFTRKLEIYVKNDDAENWRYLCILSW